MNKHGPPRFMVIAMALCMVAVAGTVMAAPNQQNIGATAVAKMDPGNANIALTGNAGNINFTNIGIAANPDIGSALWGTNATLNGNFAGNIGTSNNAITSCARGPSNNANTLNNLANNSANVKNNSPNMLGPIPVWTAPGMIAASGGNFVASG